MWKYYRRVKKLGIVGFLPRKLYSGRKHDETAGNVIYV